MRIYIALLGLLCSPVLADPPQIDSASASQVGGSWRFDVTLSHPDTGWDHYADAWRVLDPDGNELGIRVLLHPHVQEQPFTRSLSSVTIPAGVTEVLIEARCLVDGWSGVYYPLSLR